MQKTLKTKQRPSQDDNTSETEKEFEDEDLPPPDTVPVEDNTTSETDNITPDIESNNQDTDAMEVAQESDENVHVERKKQENSTRLPTTDHIEEDAGKSGVKDVQVDSETSCVQDTPRLPRKLRRLQKKLDDRRMKAQQQSQNKKEISQPINHRFPKRSNRNQPPKKYTHASTVAGNMTIETARQKHPKLYREAMRKELQQLHDKKVVDPIDVPVSGLKHSKVIGVKGFFKEKLDVATGRFKKLKFRLVPQDHRSLYSFDETTSPTVSLETVFATINVAAYTNRRGFTMDIPGAYLNAQLKEPHMVRFGIDLAAEYVNLYPQYKRHLQQDGTMILLVKKAFYGLPESSALWYEDISKFLGDLGYKYHPCDKGLFVYTDPKNPKKSCTLCLWVDDILGWATDDKLINDLEKTVIEKCDDARLCADDELQYIGMVIIQPTDNIIYVSQKEYTRKIINATGTTGYASDPNHSNLLKNKKQDKNTAANKVCKIEFASHLMMAMYLAKRTRTDILTPLSILATRMQEPGNEDKVALEKVFKCLNKTVDYKLTYKPKSMELHYWSDAAYAHRDKRCHSGIMATLGFANAPIYAKSGKQKIHTRSSTESELVALDECVLHLLWMRQILEFIGYPQNPAYTYQDNKSTIVVCETGHSKHGKLKHMAVRYYFIHGQIEQNIMKIKYCKTTNMTADLLTKPLTGEVFKKLRDNILNKQNSE